jgi:sporulation protein YlmC with PRC-barrel domain
MELEYGAKVIDKNGEVLGQVSHIASDAWSGEIRKLLVRRKAPSTDLFFSPEDVAEATKDQIKLHVTSEELARR